MLSLRRFVKPIPAINGFQLRSMGMVTGVEAMQVDAFVTSRPFSGNPAVVVFQQRNEQWMQQIAMETNIPVTAFIERTAERAYSIRWFTPTKELGLCGHATLAATHALYETGRVPRRQRIAFNRGLLSACGAGDGSIALSFPVTPANAHSITPEHTGYLCYGLGVQEHDIRFIGRTVYDLFVEVTPEAFDALQIDHQVLKQLGERGVIVTCVGAEDGFDFRSRCFLPLFGINEDSVSGSTHCALVPYWAAKLGKTEMLAYQASTRGGLLKVKLLEDKVELAGHCLTTMTMRILV